MNVVTVTVGVACVAYGIVTIVLRAKKPELFRKLGPMREKLGATAGTALHFIGYSLLPIGAGILFILRGLQGYSLLGE
ncbi:MAG TPA: hypothetical protein VM686_21600 [Polyangiaceae bacterium]|nr:hypothetical protein [Polyangiaceae bacterium]